MPDLAKERQAQLAREKRDEEERQKKLKEAAKLFKKHRAYPAARVQAAEEVEALRKNKPIDGLERFSEPLLEHVLEYTEIHARAYLVLVDNQEYLEAFAIILDDLERRSWFQLSGLPMGVIQPHTLFAEPKPEQLKLRRILDQTRHWITEAYRRISQGKADIEDKPSRRGYRSEVRAWMERRGVSSVKAAAKRLGVSDSVLKSIMSTKGKVKYSPETLDNVLRTIGFKSGDQSGDHS